MKVSLSYFYDLYDKVIEQFKDNYREEEGEYPPDYQIFGLAGSDDGKLNLAKDMMKNPEITAYLTSQPGHKGPDPSLNPSYLYNKKRSIESLLSINKLDQVQLNFPYDKALFYYLGFESYQAYTDSTKRDEVAYTGYYYSFVKHRIEDFKLYVNYNRKPKYSGVIHQEYSVRQFGYHDKPDNPEYTGYAYRLEGKLQIITWQQKEDNGDRFRIFLEAGDQPAENTIMRGALSAVASFPGKPQTSVETVVIRDDVPANDDDILRIRRYLLLHRNNFRINVRGLNLQLMEVKKVSVDIIRHLVGMWQVYRLGDTKDTPIIRSYLWIMEDYRAYCFTDAYDSPNLNEQVCLIDITSNHELYSRTVCISCFPKEGAQVISTGMLSIPRKGQDELEGVINLVGQDGRPPTMSKMLLVRDTKLTEQIAELGASEKNSLLQEKTLAKEALYRVLVSTDYLMDDIIERLS